MSRDRARRRAEREAAAAEDRVRSAHVRERRERRERRRAAVRGLVPDRPSLRPGLLARRRRRRLAVLIGIIVALCLVSWPLLPDWGARLVVLGLALLAAPVAWVLAFGRV